MSTKFSSSTLIKTLKTLHRHSFHNTDTTFTILRSTLDTSQTVYSHIQEQTLKYFIHACPNFHTKIIRETYGVPNILKITNF